MSINGSSYDVEQSRRLFLQGNCPQPWQIRCDEQAATGRICSYPVVSGTAFSAGSHSSLVLESAYLCRLSNVPANDLIR